MAVTPRKRKAPARRHGSEASSPDPLAVAMSPEPALTTPTRRTRSTPRAKDALPLMDDAAEMDRSSSRLRSPAMTPQKGQKSTPLRKDRTQVASEAASVDIAKAREAREEPQGLAVTKVTQKNPFISTETSRELFLSNEAQKRQRAARGFEFKGDVEAPVALRSGKTMKKQGGKLDEYGGLIDPGTDGCDEAQAGPEVALGVFDDGEIVEASEPCPTAAELSNQVSAVAAARRQYYAQLIACLVSPTMISKVTPTDAVQSLVSLLMGTVERGEGNSCLLIGPRGAGKTTEVGCALSSVEAQRRPGSQPIIVRLSGLVHTTDRLAIREMGRQINEAEGKSNEPDNMEDEAEDEYAPTTLPSHLLHQLTSPSPSAVIIILDNFDLFTEHPRQALLYCLLDVAQSVNAGLGSSSGRGVAVVGVTSRVDTLLLLEKRVKSRFSHRVIRTVSPLASPDAWISLIQLATSALPQPDRQGYGVEIETLLKSTKLGERMSSLTAMTTDMRIVLRPIIRAFVNVASGLKVELSEDDVIRGIDEQIQAGGWGSASAKLKGLSQPALAVLIISKHLAFAGREDFNFAQVDAEYTRFSRTKLVGSGKTRWPSSALRKAFESLIVQGLLVPVGPSRTAANHAAPRFARVRSLLQPFEVVQFFKGEGSSILNVELSNWGRLMGGHA